MVVLIIDGTIPVVSGARASIRHRYGYFLINTDVIIADRYKGIRGGVNSNNYLCSTAILSVINSIRYRSGARRPIPITCYQPIGINSGYIGITARPGTPGIAADDSQLGGIGP